MNILLFGLGAVGRTLLLVFKLKRPRFLGKGPTLTIVDKEDRRALIETLCLDALFSDVAFVRAEVNAANFSNLGRIVATRRIDLFVDATYGVRTVELLRLLDVSRSGTSSPATRATTPTPTASRSARPRSRGCADLSKAGPPPSLTWASTPASSAP